jgi:predicted nucleic acid-binding protein
MIVVDSSVWIAHLRNLNIPPVQRLRTLEYPQNILVGDLVLLEVLQGARDERHASAIEHHLRQFEVRSMLDEHLAIRAARHHRVLRQNGITIRKTIDMIIATFCIEGRHSLLHADRDFDPMADHLGLAVA